MKLFLKMNKKRPQPVDSIDKIPGFFSLGVILTNRESLDPFDLEFD
jgi:hypothetical protein